VFLPEWIVAYYHHSNGKQNSENERYKGKGWRNRPEQFKTLANTNRVSAVKNIASAFERTRSFRLSALYFF